MKLFMRAIPDTEFDCGPSYAIVTVTKQLRATIKRRFTALSRLKAKDSMVESIEGWDDSSLEWLGWFDPEEHSVAITSEQIEQADQGEIVTLENDVVIPDSVNRFRTEMDRLSVSDTGVTWHCYLKHTDVRYSTSNWDARLAHAAVKA